MKTIIQNFNIGDNLLITTDNWFFAPDGDQYRAVHGELKGVFTSEETLGVKTNAKSTNWYVNIGNMIVAGCQIHYAIKTDKANTEYHLEEKYNETEKKYELLKQRSRIYNANQ